MKSLFNKEPALIIAFAHALLFAGVSFGLNLTGEQVTALGSLLGATAALFIRGQVSSPATAETLAKAAIRPKPSPKQAEKAAQVLGVPASLIQEAIKFAAAGLLPGNWAELIVGADYSQLLEAVNDARKRTPTQDETNSEAMKGL